MKKHILSAPVYDAAAHKYLGFFDVRDMLAFVLKIIQESGKADRCEGGKGQEEAAMLSNVLPEDRGVWCWRRRWGFPTTSLMLWP